MSDCPGRFKCHGPASWCDQCGDVDLICDDPACEAHARGVERQEMFRKAAAALEQAEVEFRAAQRRYDAAKAHLSRWETGNPVMVARKR